MHIVLLWVAVAAVIGSAGRAAAAERPEPASADPVVLHLELVVNGRATGLVVPVDYDGRHLRIEARHLRAAGLRLDAADELTVVVGELPGVTVRYDPAGQRLELDVPAVMLPPQVLDAAPLRTLAPFDTASGAAFSYDVEVRRGNTGPATAHVWVEGRLFGHWGMLTSAGRYQAWSRGPTASPAFVRHDTTWTRTSRRHMRTWSAGDIVTGGHTWNRAVRLAGASVSRNFAIRPDLVTFPVPELAGEAHVPSVIDLLLDDRRVYRAGVDPGPFTIRDAPAINGAGTATIVVTDQTGRRVEQTIPFYVAGSLLRKGLTDYSLSAGFVRRRYGFASFDYGAFAGSAALRRGVSEFLTLEAHAAGTPGLINGGAGALVRVWLAGVVSSSFSLSGGSRSRQPGWQATFRYEYQSRSFGVMLRGEWRSLTFVDLADAGGRSDSFVPTAPLTSRQAFFSWSPARSLTTTMGYVEARYVSTPTRRFLTFGASRPIGRRATLSASGTSRLGDGRGHSFHLTVTRTFDQTRTVQAGMSRDESGRHGWKTLVKRQTPAAGGAGFEAGIGGGPSRAQHAALAWRSSAVEAQVVATDQNGSQMVRASARGALVAMGRSIVAASSATGGFIVVDTGIAGVPVLFENQRVGVTGADGRLVVAHVAGYHTARVAIDPLHLPADVRADVVERRVAIEPKRGTIVRFPLRRSGAALVRVVDALGRPIAVGATVVRGDGLTVVGHDGLLYLDDAVPGERLRIVTPAGACHAVLAPPAGEATHAPTLECRP